MLEAEGQHGQGCPGGVSRALSRILPSLLFLLSFQGEARLRADEFVFLEPGSQWSYFQGLSEPSPEDPLAWSRPEFDDTSWARGAAPFGFGRAGPFGVNLADLEPPMQANYSTIFLRTTMEVFDGERVGELHFRAVHDDGFVLWVNGREILRIGVDGDPGQPVPADTTAAVNTISPAEADEFVLNPDFLETGVNVVAVQVVNRTIQSSDLKFDLEVIDTQGPDFTPPETARLVPTPGTIARRFETLEITFNEAVTGVQAAALSVAGTPAVAVSGSGAGPYLFEFSQPPTGTVTVEWAADAGITDDSPQRNPLGAASWTYTVDPEAPPPNVVISEFMAANHLTLLDEDGDKADWLELWNRGPFAEELAGWSLTDDPEVPDLWIFPPTKLESGQRLLILASGKTRPESDEPLHANFKLSKGGEYLALFDNSDPRHVVHDYSPKYPEQHFDISYGIDAQGEVGFFNDPTPGEEEVGSALRGFTEALPVFSPPRGFYDAPFELELASPAGGEVFYTLDGSLPTPEDGILYESPIEIRGEIGQGVRMVRAVAVRPGFLASGAATHSYLFAEQVLTQPDEPEGFPRNWGSTRADYTLEPEVIEPNREAALEGLRSLATLSIVTDFDHLFDVETGVYANPSLSGPDFERPVSAELIYGDDREGFQIDCGIRTQGGSSTQGWKSRKVSLRLLFKDEYGPRKLHFPLYPDYPVDRFNTLVLDAGLNLTLAHADVEQRRLTQIVRDQTVADLQNDAGGFAHRSVFVNLYLNGAHWGVYGVHERNDAAWASELFGGSDSDYDVLRHNTSNVVDGVSDSYEELLTSVDADLSVAENYEAVERLVDVDQLITYMLINTYVGNTDWAAHNWYASYRHGTGTGFQFHSWDAEHVLKLLPDDVTSKDDPQGPTHIFQRLSTTPDFRLLFADQVHKHFFKPSGLFWVDPEDGTWNPEHPERNRPAQLYMRRIEEVRSAVPLEFARWGDLQQATPHSILTWIVELDRLLETYFPDRSARVLSQLRGRGLYPEVLAPSFDRTGDEVPAASQVGLSLPADATGTIYYTLDRSDPRVPGSGAISPTATAYAGPISLSDLTVVKARNFAGTDDGAPQWSALNQEIFKISTSNPAILRISEIMYQPLGNAEHDSRDLEFVEVYNSTAATIDLTGIAFTSGVQFTFPEGASVGPRSHVVVASNPEALLTQYPGIVVAGGYGGRLANEGEKVTLAAVDGTTIDSVEFDDSGFWPLAADGFGFSLVLADPENTNIDPDDPRTWRASAEPGGSPGEVGPGTSPAWVLIHEVETGLSPAVELANLGTASIDVGGWYLSRERSSMEALLRYRIPAGRTLGPGEFLVLTAEELGGDFELPDEGGELYLTAVDSNGELTGHLVGVSYGPRDDGANVGIHVTSTDLEFVALSQSTLGAENALPLEPEVVIHEIHYHPADGDTEFLELHNPTSAALSLDGWALSGISDPQGEDDFLFPQGTRLEAGAYLVLATADVEAFRLQHGISPDVAILSPFAGALDNAGERLRLLRPHATASGLFVLVDAVRYNDRAPWPSEADGDGASLERRVATAYGNEPVNWGASLTPGGTPGAPNSVGQTPPEPSTGHQVPGDLNQDRRLNIVDAILLLEQIAGTPGKLPCAGMDGDSSNTTLLDGDGDGEVNLSDAVHLLNFLFQRGSAHAGGQGCLEMAGCPEACAS